MNLETLEVETLIELISQQCEYVQECEIPKHEKEMTLAFYEALLVKLEVEYARLSLLDELKE